MSATHAAETETPSTHPRPLLRLEGVRKSFGDNLVLDGIDLDVPTGEVLVIIGPSGSGKSTLLRCVNLLEPIDRRAASSSRARRSPRKGVDVPAVAAADRDRLPAVQPLPAPDRDRQPDARGAADPEAAPRRGRAARARAARARRAPGEGGAAPAPALGRPAAARRDRARADDGAARDALRRGHLGARPRARRRGARRDARPRARRDDDARRHPRDAVRARGRRPASSSWTRARSSSRAVPADVLDRPQEERTRRFLRRSLQLADSLEELSITDEEGAAE